MLTDRNVVDSIFRFVVAPLAGFLYASGVVNNSLITFFYLRTQLLQNYGFFGHANSIACHLTCTSLHSKRFCGVGEQRKSEERDFRRFACAKNGTRAKKRKEGEGEGKEGNACQQQQQQQFFSVFPYKYMVLPNSNVITIVNLK